jgi:hypothetical protein
MFIEAVIIAIIIGYIAGGRLKRLENADIKGIYLVFTAFLTEAVIMFLIRKDIVQRGTLTYMLDVIMYVQLAAFTWINRKNPWLVITGAGFLLNSIPIFLNGGAMPVSMDAAVKSGFVSSAQEVNLEARGLYTAAVESTRLWFLGDVIPKSFIMKSVISIGDIVSSIGIMGFIITRMRKVHPVK